MDDSTDYWVDYAWAILDCQGITRRWCATYKEFVTDLTELQTSGQDILAFGYRANPPPLTRPPTAGPQETRP